VLPANSQFRYRTLVVEEQQSFQRSRPIAAAFNVRYHPAMSKWRASFRQLRRRPAFAVTVILLLALGIGINTTVFSIVETVLLKPLPYPSADRLVYLFEADPAKNEKRSRKEKLVLHGRRASSILPVSRSVYRMRIADRRR
jgi:hypothetical protein